jgi:hypothetical protein
MPDNPTHHSKWLLLLKIDISSIVHIGFKHQREINKIAIIHMYILTFYCHRRMSDRKKKRREYKRKWMANARLRSKHFVEVSSSEEECEITDPCSLFHVPLSSAYNSQQLPEVQVGISFSDGQINEHLDVDGRREDSEADENSKEFR